MESDDLVLVVGHWIAGGMSKIVTVYNRPPIPQYSALGHKLWEPWTAYHDGEEESGHYGSGETEADAIGDLKRMDREREEYESSWRHSRGV